MMFLHIILFVKVVCCFESAVLVADSVEERLLKLESIVTQHQGTIEKLENSLKELKSENDGLKEKLFLVESRAEYQEERIKNLGAEVEKLKAIANRTPADADAENQMERKNDKIASPKSNATRNGYTFETSVHRIRRFSSRDSSNVAFHAMMGTSRCFQVHEPYIFDSVEVDIGNGYNYHDGIYNVPSAGTYVFAFSIVSDHNNWLRAELVVNGVVKVTAVSDAETAEDYHPSFAMAVVNVHAGDHVFVRGGGFSNCKVVSDGAHGRATFSGWKLF